MRSPMRLFRARFLKLRFQWNPRGLYSMDRRHEAIEYLGFDGSS
jgi:hypothetical protein